MRRSLAKHLGEPSPREIAAFVPYPLPPRDPPLKLDGELAALLLRAQQALARLEVAGEMCHRSTGSFMHLSAKEPSSPRRLKVLRPHSSIFSNTKPNRQLESPSTMYVRSATTSMPLSTHEGSSKSARGLPISTRLLNETHRRLMRGVASNKQPGEIRPSQTGSAAHARATPCFVPAHLKSYQRC